MSKQPPRSARIEIVPCEGIDFAGGPHFLRLRASNGATLCHSENYSSLSNARRAAVTWLTAFDDVVASSLSGGGDVIEVES